MDEWNKFLKRRPSNIEGSSLLHSPKLAFDEPLWVASPEHSHCSSGEQSESGLIWVGESGDTA